MLKIIIAMIATFLTFSLTWGHIGGQISKQDIRDIKPQKYCGPVLSNALALLCYAENDKVGKRTEHSMYNAILPPLYKEEDVPYWPWLLADRARSVRFQSRRKRYVVDECCFKACNIDELMSYC